MWWLDLRRVERAVLTASAAIAAAGTFVLVAGLVHHPVVVEAGCLLSPSAARITQPLGTATTFSLPLPAATDRRAHIVAIESVGTVDRRDLRFAAIPADRAGRLATSPWSGPLPRALSRAMRPLEEIELPRGAQTAVRGPWTLLVTVRPREPGIYALGALEITYRARDRTTRCFHDLSIPIVTGMLTEDVSRQLPVHRGAGYAHLIETACGIRGASFGGIEWRADPIVRGSAGGAPPGWESPHQAGIMRLVRPDFVEFKSGELLRTGFRPTRASDPPLAPCPRASPTG